MPRRQSEIQIFSTSFLDLLSCGMGGMIILWIIFVSSSLNANKDAFSFCVVAFELEYAETAILNEWDLLIDGQPVASATFAGGAWSSTVMGTPVSATPDQSVASSKSDGRMQILVMVDHVQADLAAVSQPCSPAGVLHPCTEPMKVIISTVLRKIDKPSKITLQVRRKSHTDVSNVGFSPIQHIGKSNVSLNGPPTTDDWAVVELEKSPGEITNVGPFPMIDARISTPVIASGKTVTIPRDNVSVVKDGPIEVTAAVDGDTGQTELKVSFP